MDNLTANLYLLQRTGVMMQTKRSHHRNLGNTFDTTASHSFHAAIIGYSIARMEKLSHSEASQVCLMGLIHDIAETLTGDLDFITKNYAKIDEKRAVVDQFKDLEYGKDLINSIKEYEERKTLGSQCAKDADLIEQMYQEWVLMWQGNKLAEKWFTGKLKLVVPKLYTKSAKKLVKAMTKSDPQEWWYKELSGDNYNSKNLTGRV